MGSRHVLIALAALGCGALASGRFQSGSYQSGSHQSGSFQPVGCDFGLAQGSWDLPQANQNGVVDGWLHQPLGQVPPYHFVGTLVDTPSPCLSCVEGDIHGILDDGIGVGPDYIVDGHYLGSFFAGSGSFVADVRRPWSAAIVGKIRGKFQDLPSSTNVGAFHGRWRICN